MIKVSANAMVVITVIYKCMKSTLWALLAYTMLSVIDISKRKEIGEDYLHILVRSAVLNNLP